ncbi:hypothetical protein PHYPO_G00132930 [Pangasianodon hypophthalmus]|uniref:Uncharacterized protein n=1 Tax=Pangasianodon hypophthalmus TaxID=310915 RepID=A0A5N5KK54_PANHP|nr:hypothetical protein PHYPO_G00132930 [Pangasianodon hypophthalmus]
MQICLAASAEAVRLFPTDIPFKGVFKVALTARRLRGSGQCTKTKTNAHPEAAGKTRPVGESHCRGLCTNTRLSGCQNCCLAGARLTTVQSHVCKRAAACRHRRFMKLSRPFD